MITVGFFSVGRAAGVAIGRGAPGTAFTGIWLSVSVFFFGAGFLGLPVATGAVGFTGSAFLAAGIGLAGAFATGFAGVLAVGFAGALAIGFAGVLATFFAAGLAAVPFLATGAAFFSYSQSVGSCFLLF
jgi:hypothetical protein